MYIYKYRYIHRYDMCIGYYLLRIYAIYVKFCHPNGNNQSKEISKMVYIINCVTNNDIIKKRAFILNFRYSNFQVFNFPYFDLFRILFNPINADGWQKYPTLYNRYNFLYIFQTTCTIILKFLVSNLLSISGKKIKNLKVSLFLNSTGHTHVSNGCE